MPSGRNLSIWFACLSVLLLIFTAAHLNPLGSMLAAILAPLPVLLTGWRLKDKGALTLVLAGIAFMLALQPGLETLWQNLGFLSLLLMGLLLSVLQNRGLSPTRAIFATVLILSGLALLLLVGQAFYQGITLQQLAPFLSRQALADRKQPALAGEVGDRTARPQQAKGVGIDQCRILRWWNGRIPGIQLRR